MNLALTLSISSIILTVVAIIAYNKILKPRDEYFGLHCGVFVVYIGSIGLANDFLYDYLTLDMRFELEEHSNYIYSLGDTQKNHGDFFLGTGTIDEKSYYKFYIKTENGFKRVDLPVDQTFIVETDERSPEHVKVFWSYADGNSFWKVLEDDFRFHRIYVPTKTIIREFQIN